MFPRSPLPAKTFSCLPSMALPSSRGIRITHQVCWLSVLHSRRETESTQSHYQEEPETMRQVTSICRRSSVGLLRRITSGFSLGVARVYSSPSTPPSTIRAGSLHLYPDRFMRVYFEFHLVCDRTLPRNVSVLCCGITELRFSWYLWVKIPWMRWDTEKILQNKWYL